MKEKDGRYRTKIVDRKNLNKLNKYLFCYDYKSYKDLLYNDQIRKFGENCPDEYSYDCGIIGTLNQHLCVEGDDNGSNCPSYEIGLGVEKDSDSESYEYEKEDDKSIIYYSKNGENYKKENKKIISKLILNEGQPCFKLSEKLWRIFVGNEVYGDHLKCELEILGEFTDDRFEKKGAISYFNIYRDNLSTKNFKKLKDKLTEEFKVS